jgi:hypothetical protein
VPFKVEAQNDSKALGQLGLASTSANTDGTVVMGSKITAVAPDAVAKKEFDAAAKVNLTDDTIELGANHGLKTGDAVVYNKGGETATAIGGLEEGKTYYVITDGATKVKLATTAALASAGTAIDLTSVGSGTQSLTIASAAPVSAGGSLGIGVSVALNIANTTALAQIADTAVITAKTGSSINDVILSADSITSATTTTTAGGEAKGGSGVGIGGAISIAVLNTDTRAEVGLGPIPAPSSPRQTEKLPGAARRWGSRLG